MLSELTTVPHQSMTKSCECKLYYTGEGQQNDKSERLNEVPASAHPTVISSTGHEQLGSRKVNLGNRILVLGSWRPCVSALKKFASISGISGLKFCPVRVAPPIG